MKLLKKIKIGIIGPGRHFENKIYPVLKKNTFFVIDSITGGKKKYFKNYKLLSSKDFFKRKLDFVYISTPNESHEKYIIKSLQNKINIICEKPFITKKKNLFKIINLSKKNKKLIFEAFMYRYHPVFNEIKKMIKSKNYGNIRYLISNWKFPHLEKKRSMYLKKKGNGFWYDSASYLLSLDNYFFTKKKKITVTKIRKDITLRGAITISSNNINRYYFWGEGQSYKNDIEVFFTNATIYVQQFYAKKDDENITLKIFKDFKIYEKKFLNVNQFSLMFKNIALNYFKKKYQRIHRNLIRNQSLTLSKSF